MKGGVRLAGLEGGSSLAAEPQGDRAASYLFFDVTISAREGRSLVLLGPNGCGKTSVARALLGLLPVSSGRRQVRPGLRSAYMPQDYRNAAFPWLTLGKNLALRFRQSSGEATDREELTDSASKEVVELFRRLDLSLDLSRYPGEVSGGQLQLILLVATLVMPADLRVLDEPFSALDYRRRAMAARVVAERIHQRPNEGWVLITHDIPEGVSLADDVAVLSPTRNVSAMVAVPWKRPRAGDIRSSPGGLSALEEVRKAAGLA